MEEQKKNSKEIKMQPNAGSDKEKSQEKLPYDKLQEIANTLWNENRQMRQQLLSIDRMDYLLRVISIANNCKNYSFDTDFIQNCIDEVQKVITLPEEGQTEANKEN